MGKFFFYNGNIITMDEANEFIEAVLVEGDKIRFCGNYEEGRQLVDDETTYIDLNGKTLLPGFNDSHMHLISYGLTKYKVNLLNAQSIEEIQHTLVHFLSKERNKIFKDWVLGHGWNHESFKEKVLPNKEDIDRVINDRPVFLARACYHICVVNSKALELAGITKDTKDPEGGRIDRDPLTGEPTGVLRENALYLVYNIIPFTDNIAEIKELILSSISDANKVGLTSIQTDDFSHLKSFNKIIDAYSQLKNEGRLKARINLQMLLENHDKLTEFLKLGIKSGDGDEYLRFGPLKILGDGSLGSRTAALEEPYEDDPTTDGVLIYKDNELEELLDKAHNNGLQIAIHAIGDRCMNQILKLYDGLQKKYQKEDPRFRIIHCQIGSEEIFNKFLELDVIADIQPIFTKTDMHMADKRVGKKRIEWSYIWKTMMKKGIRLSGSSDAPVEPFDPILGVYTAVTRQDLKGIPEGGWYPQESLSIYEALKLFTTNSAYSTFEDDIKGKIKPGMLADLVVLSENIIKLPASDIKDIKVELTILGGEIVFQR